jgi:NAD-dependent DNA ligase
LGVVTNGVFNPISYLVDDDSDLDIDNTINQDTDNLSNGLVDTICDFSYYPDPKVHGSYSWNKSHKELVLHHDNDEVRREKMLHFIETMGIKNLGRKRIKKLFNNGITSIDSLLVASINQLSPILGSGMAPKIFSEIKLKTTEAPLSRVMYASCFFPGIGEGLFEQVLEVHPNILYMADMDQEALLKELQKVRGFKKRAEIVVKQLFSFVEWLNNNSNITIAPIEVPQYNAGSHQYLMMGPNVPNNLLNETIVFSGFRTGAPELSRQVKSRGGRVTTSVSKKTTIVVTESLDSTTSKVEDARKLGIPIIQKNDFIKQYLS